MFAKIIFFTKDKICNKENLPLKKFVVQKRIVGKKFFGKENVGKKELQKKRFKPTKNFTKKWSPKTNFPRDISSKIKKFANKNFLKKKNVCPEKKFSLGK